MSLKERINRLMWKAYIARLSMRAVFRLNLGDQVIYNGEKWCLYQGVAAPMWGLTQGNGVVCRAHEKDFRKVRSLENYLGSYRSMRRFYMTSWFESWCRNGIQPWMVACNIWSGKPPKIKTSS